MTELRQAAAAWVFDESGRILLIKENYDRRRYGPPGGAVERGESPVEAACREFIEETGATFEPAALIGLHHFVTRCPTPPRRSGVSSRAKCVDFAPNKVSARRSGRPRSSRPEFLIPASESAGLAS
ncbi:MAG TPA: NUDIX hydrolase [Gaiellaceae bacterium]